MRSHLGVALTFVFNDIFTEVYGYRRSRQIIWSGLAVQLFTAFIYWAVGVLPSASFWHNQSAYDVILGQAPRVVFGTMLAYLAGEYINSVAISKLKFLQKGRNGSAQCIRFVTSTALGEFVDTLIFFPVAFLGVVPVADLVKTMACIYVAKVLYEIFSLPVSTFAAEYVKNAEHIDIIDNPSTDYGFF